MLPQWRAGLRVSEALSLEAKDVQLEGKKPTLRVRRAKGGKEKLVPLHPELRAALGNALAFGGVGPGRLFPVTRATAWRWVKGAQRRAVEAGAILPGKRVGTHTRRHSAARQWLASGVPVNRVALWLATPASRPPWTPTSPCSPTTWGRWNGVP